MAIVLSENDLQYLFLAYLSTALYRQRMKYIRQMHKQAIYELSIEDMDQIADPYVADSEFDLHEPAVMICVNISERDRNIVKLHALSGMKLCAIADLLDLSVPATQKAYQRALAKMRMVVTKNI